MSEVKIRLAREEDIARVVEIYEEFLDYEKIHGTHTNWIKGVYPTENNARRAFESDTLFVGLINDKIVGSYILNKVQPEEYKKIPWKLVFPEEEILVIHTLCIDVKMQKRGLGKAFVDFSIEHGRDIGCKAIRLDTWENNHPAAKLYERMGFAYAGMTEFFFEQAILENLITFEYQL